jgi:DNA-binding HxlR family transcriptional regulator
MKRADNRSHCPVNFALEVIGDSWSLLIVRDIVFWGKNTYGEFMNSAEHIATNVLASRLAHLEDKGILVKKPHPTDKRKEVYELTEQGLDLIPVLLEMCGWSSTYDPLTEAPKDFVAQVYANREAMFKLIRETVQAGGSLFIGPNSVVSKLPLASS